MIMEFGVITLIVSIYYFSKVFKLMLMHGFTHISDDELLSGLDRDMPLWQHLLLSLFGVCMSLWILFYDQNILGIF